jgi:DNA-binding NarL/FixJ family response regulator
MNAPPLVRIVIADDHALFAEALRRLLGSEPDFEVVATCSDGSETVRQVRALRPDVLLLDLAMPDGDGLEVLERLAPHRPEVRVVMLTAAIDSDEMLRAIQLGARGVLLKDTAPQFLFKCVRAVMHDDYWVGREHFAGIARRLQDRAQRESPPPASTLSERELHIVGAVVGGAGNREIAKQLDISVQTVKNHLSHIFDKLGVSSRLELALYAKHHHLLDPRFKGGKPPE